MNHKAAISKELDAKHVKILEGLLKLPENRECADCKTKAPRWASINLGIFICLQCSGIHRSLGVHISKVRSATLDTWLPEQIAFMQSMGNEKSNGYWEAELPAHNDRSRVETFIRAKYVDRKWIPRTGKVRSPLKFKEELASGGSSRSGSGSSIAEFANTIHLEGKVHLTYKQEGDSSTGSSPQSHEVHNDKENSESQPQKQMNENHLLSADERASDSVFVYRGAHKESTAVHPATSYPSYADGIQKSEPGILKVESLHASTPAIQSSKVDYTSELFRMLYMEDSTESDLSPSSDTSTWVGFESDEEVSAQGMVVPKSSTGKIHPEPTIKDVTVKGILVAVTKRRPEEHLDNAVNANQINPLKPSICQKPSLNVGGVNHTTGTNMLMQNLQPLKVVSSLAPHNMSSLYKPATAINGVSTSPATRPPTTLPVSGYDYDFSFLTQGMLTKR